MLRHLLRPIPRVRCRCVPARMCAATHNACVPSLADRSWCSNADSKAEYAAAAECAAACERLGDALFDLAGEPNFNTHTRRDSRAFGVYAVRCGVADVAVARNSSPCAPTFCASEQRRSARRCTVAAARRHGAQGKKVLASHLCGRFALDAPDPIRSLWCLSLSLFGVHST